MERCEFCGSRLGVECDGVQYWAPDPYAEEIGNDSSDYFECDGYRAQSAMDI